MIYETETIATLINVHRRTACWVMIAVQSHCYSARKTRAESWRETAQRQVRKKSVCSFNFLKRIILSLFVVVLPLSCPLSSVLELERSVLETWFVPLMGHRNKEAYTSMQRMDKSIKSYLWLYLWNLILFFIKWTIFVFLNNALRTDLFPVWIQDTDAPQLSQVTLNPPLVTLQ